MMPETTTKAPVGPPICTIEPPSADQETSDHSAVQASLGRHPRRDGKGHHQRQRDQANRHAGNEVRDEDA
jgi:hypothetical protein